MAKTQNAPEAASQAAPMTAETLHKKISGIFSKISENLKSAAADYSNAPKWALQATSHLNGAAVKHVTLGAKAISDLKLVAPDGTTLKSCSSAKFIAELADEKARISPERARFAITVLGCLAEQVLTASEKKLRVLRILFDGLSPEEILSLLETAGITFDNMTDADGKQLSAEQKAQLWTLVMQLGETSVLATHGYTSFRDVFAKSGKDVHSADTGDNEEFDPTKLFA